MEFEEEKSSPSTGRNRTRGQQRSLQTRAGIRRTVTTRAGAESAEERDRITCLNCRIRHRDGFLCDRNTHHVSCSGCGGSFPLRTGPSVQCELCDKYFCNLYWNCSGTGANKLERVEKHKMRDWPSGDGTLPAGVLDCVKRYLEG